MWVWDDHARSTATPAEHWVQIYYEDTDHSGVVYHPNYLKYCERAREDMLGINDLLALLSKETGFAVYKAALIYREGARFGDRVKVQTWVHPLSEHRLSFWHRLVRGSDDAVLVDAEIELVCLHKNKLVPLPQEVIRKLRGSVHLAR